MVEYINISEAVNQSVGRSGRTTYKEEEKIRITKYAHLHTTTNDLKHFKKEFPNLSEPSIRRWLSTYRKHLTEGQSRFRQNCNLGKKRKAVISTGGTGFEIVEVFIEYPESWRLYQPACCFWCVDGPH